jgi:hypothetical protein
MSNKNLKITLLQALNEDISKYGFVLRKSQNEFFQKCDVGENRFEITFYTKYLLSVTCATSIRCSIIQDIYCNILQSQGYVRRYHTFYSMMQDHPNFRGSFEFIIDKEENISEPQRNILKYFQTVSLDFYRRYDSLEKIFQLYSGYTTKEETLVRQNASWYDKTLILAKVLGKKEYPELVKEYREKVKHWDQGIYLPTFEKVVSALESYPSM